MKPRNTPEHSETCRNTRQCSARATPRNAENTAKQGETCRIVSSAARAETGETNGTPPKGGVFRVVSFRVSDLPDRLDDLARRVARLVPSRHDPERYHAEKSEIAFELRQLARFATQR